VVSAISEVQLGEVDHKAGDKADPVGDPECFSPEIAGNQRWQQNVDDQEQNFVVAVENNWRFRLEQIAADDNEMSGDNSRNNSFNRLKSMTVGFFNS
jgi:hypothetical protein